MFSLGDAFHGGSRELHGEVAIVFPEFEQVAVVRAVHVARLAGSVRAECVIPVAGLDDEAEGRPGRLILSATRAPTVLPSPPRGHGPTSNFAFCCALSAELIG